MVLRRLNIVFVAKFRFSVVCEAGFVMSVGVWADWRRAGSKTPVIRTRAARLTQKSQKISQKCYYSSKYRAAKRFQHDIVQSSHKSVILVETLLPAFTI